MPQAFEAMVVEDPVSSDSFELDTLRYELRRGDHVLRLEKIPMELLILLAERKDQLVGRQEIVEKLWGKDVFLDTDQGVNTAIRKIRLALHDDPEQPRYLQTVVGKGYRLIGPITVVGSGYKDAGQRPPGPSELRTNPGLRQSHLLSVAAVIAGVSITALIVIAIQNQGLRDRILNRNPGIRSIAVLPLVNLSGDPTQEYFADGMTDALITDLAQIHSLRVISRTSAVHYQGSHKSLPEIARELNVDAVVEGTVSRSANRVRITAQLVHAPTDRHLWAQSYEKNLGDILGLQGEIALDIAREISATLTPREQLRLTHSRPVNPEAQEAYLRGRYLLDLRNNENLDRAPEYFQQAIEKDPNFAAAYAGVADCYLFLYAWGHLSADEARTKARAAITKALELDDGSSEAHASLGYYQLEYERDPNRIEAEFKLALELNSNNSDAHKYYAFYLMQVGRLDEATAEAMRALDLDPFAPHLNASAGHIFFDARQYLAAIKAWQRAIELDPSLYFWHNGISSAYAHRGMHDEAIREELGFLENMYQQRTNPHWAQAPKIAALFKKAYADSGYSGYLRSKLGREFAEIMKCGSGCWSHYERAVLYAQLGEKDHAFEALAMAVKEHNEDLVELLVDPDLEALHSDPRFEVLLHQCRAECGKSRPF
jgi:TolB-like protein/DNA-binding winged helix-turn-helix (wHTH) protein/Tfp pilus assembly protein PilF